MGGGHDHQRGAVTIRRLGDGPALAQAAAAVADLPGGFVLESSAPHQRGGRYSILGWNPVATVRIDESDGGNWLERLAERIGKGDARYARGDLPFVGGWVGFISYEAGPLLESVPVTAPADINLPLVQFSLYESAAVYDYRTERWTLATADLAGGGRRSASEKLDALERILGSAPAAEPTEPWTCLADEPEPVLSVGEYLARVKEAKRYITAGDSYEINLTQRFTTRTRASAARLYERVRESNPAAYSALLRCDGTAIISASPELFLDLREGHVVTRPIKGTRPRNGDPLLDRVRAAELLESEKDRAELNMIIDLMRNDLGRVCEFGSVRVTSAGDLETHPTVMHLVGTVEGRLRGGLGWADLLRASFPGGSITGAPKIRTMQIIDELEPTRRSVYCGSIGHIGLDGSMCLNIAIRTMVLDDGNLHLFSGGAITADSDPHAEYEETLAKIAGLTRALRGVGVDRAATSERRSA